MEKIAEKLLFSTYSLVRESWFVAQNGALTMSKFWIIRYTRKYTGQVTLLKGVIIFFLSPFILFSFCNIEIMYEVLSVILYMGNLYSLITCYCVITIIVPKILRPTLV